jgi:hypothetical protein
MARSGLRRHSRRFFAAHSTGGQASILSDIIGLWSTRGSPGRPVPAKIRVSRRQVRHVVGHAGLVFVREPSLPERADEALLFLGDDEHGVPLEVLGVELADGRLRVIHAMEMRAAYGDLHEEAKAWLR